MAKAPRPGIPPAGAEDRPRLSDGYLKAPAARAHGAPPGTPRHVTPRQNNPPPKRRDHAAQRGGAAAPAAHPDGEPPARGARERPHRPRPLAGNHTLPIYPSTTPW